MHVFHLCSMRVALCIVCCMCSAGVDLENSQGGGGGCLYCSAALIHVVVIALQYQYLTYLNPNADKCARDYPTKMLNKSNNQTHVYG